LEGSLAFLLFSFYSLFFTVPFSNHVYFSFFGTIWQCKNFYVFAATGPDLHTFDPDLVSIRRKKEVMLNFKGLENLAKDKNRMNGR